MRGRVTATYTPTVTITLGPALTHPAQVLATSANWNTPTFQGGDPLVPIDETVEPTFEDSKEKSYSRPGELGPRDCARRNSASLQTSSLWWQTRSSHSQTRR